MPFRPPKQAPSPSDLTSSLNDTKTSQTNNALYQTIFGLIKLASELKDGVEKSIKKTDKIPTSQLTGNISYKNGGTEPSTFVPILNNLTNITSSASFVTTWWRFGNLVFVSGKVTITPTAGAVGAEVLTELEMDLPLLSNFLHTEQVSGTMNGVPFSGTGTGVPGIIWGNPSNKKATFWFLSPETQNLDVRFMFSYEWIPYTT